MNYKYPDLDYRQHLRCPDCPKLMIKRMSTTIDNVIDGNPAKGWYYWCNCGATVSGGLLRGLEETTWAKREWERVNNVRREE